MTPDELRNAIARDQGWTMCRCGHYLAACADCMGWMRENSARIALQWKWYVENRPFQYQDWCADQMEADDLAFYLGAR